MFEGRLSGADVAAGVIVEVAGLPCALSAADARRGEAVAAFLRHAPKVDAEPRIQVAFTGGSVDVTDRAPSQVLDDVRLWHDEATLVVAVGDSMIAEAVDGCVTVRGDDPSLARAFRRVAVYALGHVLADHGRTLVHGATVARGDLGILVLGRTGSGKSTLAYAALRRGWDVIADDLVAATGAPGDRVLVAGIPRPICVPPDLDGVEGIRSHPIDDDARARLELGAGTARHGEIAVGGVVVVCHGPEPAGSLARLGSLDVLRHVLASSVTLADPRRRGDVLTLTAAVSRRPAWVLRHAAEPTSRVDLAGHRLEEIVRELGVADLE